MRKLLATAFVVLGLTGISAAFAPSASALACLTLNVSIGDTPVVTMSDPICI